ncbi:sigma 54-interacting transcriptional regulator [Flavobacterium aquidurense]|uniref:sigma 54-interacting transcriptional regulator n=1 Tax=Flavobacterium aquidurense TaxID=362413 RepID=UPI0028600906|nr:sigma 54-interacting transcriptional regulator [Flavobacterium aquidurense]MDR7372976.1 transcriptional regulator with GAF, ATPase, and Fis domain [Flavobacterium aquidurense]
MKYKINKELDGVISDIKMQIAAVNDRSELLKTLNNSLSKLFDFTSIFIQYVDHYSGTYYPFLIDHQSKARNLNEFKALSNTRASLGDPIVRDAVEANKSFIISLKDFVNEEAVPYWIKINFEFGIREGLVTPLIVKNDVVGICYIWSENQGSFGEDFLLVMDALLMDLGYAISNTTINEMLTQREWTNELLFAFSHDLAEVKTREHLTCAVGTGLRNLVAFDEFLIIDLLTDEQLPTFIFSNLIIENRQLQWLRSNSFIKNIFKKTTDLNMPVILQLTDFDDADLPLCFSSLSNEKPQELLLKALPGASGPQFGLILVSNKSGVFNAPERALIQRISGHLGTAVSNVVVNEELVRREKDKEILLAFSHDIASVRDKDGLKKAIEKVSTQMSSIARFVIRGINEDQQSMSLYIYDSHVKQAIEELGHHFVLDAIYPINDGISDVVLAGNETIVYELQDWIDAGKAPSYFHFWRSMDVQKCIATPLKTADGNLGIFWVDAEYPDVLMINSICAQISIAMSNIKANEGLIRREKDKEILLAFSHDIAAVRDKDDLRKAIEKVSNQLSNIARFLIRGVNDDQETMTIYLYDDKVKKGIEEAGQQFILNAVFPLNDGISELILEGNETKVFELQEYIDAGKASSCIHFWKSMGAQKCVATPLKTAGRNLGIFWVDSEYPDVKMISSICAQISIAMSNILANEELLKFKQRLEVENAHLQEQIREIYNSSEIIGTSAAMQKVYQLMSLVSHSNATVLIEGETGTGKELIARGIHDSSHRKNQIMVKVNCAALPLSLIESELFGYEKGAFTGAYEKRIGKFELAHRGTLFLDEIGELPLEVQVKLLRVLQEREFERLGGRLTIKVDVRIIAATNRDLKAEVAAGRFRSDLYYRLNVFPIVLPPLRDRREDIPCLAHFFLARYSKSFLGKISGISAGAMNELRAYSWPGNVRELEHMIERSVLLSDTKTLTKVYLPQPDASDHNGYVDIIDLESVEKQHIIEVLRRCNGKISGKGGAAELLGLPASTLNSKMRKLGITVKTAMI